MISLINNKLHEWNSKPQDEQPRACLISGTGGKAFCAGGDIVSLYHAHNGKEGYPAS